MPTRGSSPTARLLRLAALQAAGPRTAADLARQLGVTTRTRQRDLHVRVLDERTNLLGVCRKHLVTG